MRRAGGLCEAVGEVKKLEKRGGSRYVKVGRGKREERRGREGSSSGKRVQEGSETYLEAPFRVPWRARVPSLWWVAEEERSVAEEAQTEGRPDLSPWVPIYEENLN